MLTFVYIILLAGFVFFFIGLLPRESETISVFGKEVKEMKSSVFSPILLPFAPVNKIILKFFRAEPALANRMYLARWKITPAEFLSVKELILIFTPLILFFVFLVHKPLWILGATLFGFLFPDIILNSKVKKRKYSIVRVLPETVDLLALCVGAGLDFMAAVRWVVNKVKINPLIEELANVLKEINVGKPRIEALRELSRRVSIPDITSFVRTLIQADRMGTPVEETFKILSEDTRLRRFHRGERIAMKAPIKMLIPLIFCILPVILIIIGGPIIIDFMTRGLFTVGQ